MTPAEILAGFDALQKHFGKSYSIDQVEAVWRDLLVCSETAFNRAVGSLIKGSRFLPRVDYVLERTRVMERQPVALAVWHSDTDPGHKAMELLNARLSGMISEREYIAELWRMSEVYQSARYAIDARRRESTLKG